MTRYVIKAPIAGITSDSRMVQKNYLFVAYPGHAGDGRDYISDAIKRGAVAVVWDDEDFTWNPAWDVKNVAIPHLRLQAGHIASQFYKKPSSKLWNVGVTGTNGKTSVSHWIAQAFTYLSRKSAVVGTLGNGFLGALSPTHNTTPGPIELQRLLAGILEDDGDVVAMEVSSHALDQGRVNGVDFDVAVFTNLSRDHLDYHKNMRDYQNAKRQLFDWPSLKACVINQDDSFGKKMVSELNVMGRYVVTYGIKAGQVRATKLVMEDTFFTSHIKTPYGNADVKIPLIGEFNVYNVLAVLSTLLVSQVPLDEAILALTQLTPVTGRMQMFGGGPLPLVVVDYAHTPDALEKVLTTLKLQAKSKLVCVFGCGGDRDPGKRAQMGKVASTLADAVVVTSDNPRSESPERIIMEITKGMEDRYLVEIDREKAIEIAILSAKPNDIVLVAGKGHEDYQEVAGVKHFFSDAQQVQTALNHYAQVQA
jgi:UDP-N-acetylmuramoyl-L-alanyl-D-glutamate--2,6-diaminopimelate ligase